MSTYFNMVWRKWVNLGVFEKSATECRGSGRRTLASRLTFGPNENSPPQRVIREPQRRVSSWTAILVISGSLANSSLSDTGYLGKTPAEWASKGTGPRYARFGRHVRYRLSDVVDWEAQQFADLKRTSCLGHDLIVLARWLAARRCVLGSTARLFAST